MKIKKIKTNNKKNCFELETSKDRYTFPFSKLDPKPHSKNKILEVYIDPELDYTGVTYTLESGEKNSFLLDQVMEYNKDSEYMRRQHLYLLTDQVLNLIDKSKISKREIIRRMQTSPTQFYRLLSTTNYNKTIDQMIKLLSALDCHVKMVFRKAA